MAANKRLWQTEKTREKIRTSQLLNRLEAYALGEDDPNGHPIKMEQGQVKAALGIIAKVLPDLSSADITNHDAPEQSMEQKFQSLVNQIGPDKARMIYPDLAAKYLGESKQPNTDAPKAVQ